MLYNGNESIYAKVDTEIKRVSVALQTSVALQSPVANCKILILRVCVINVFLLFMFAVLKFDFI